MRTTAMMSAATIALLSTPALARPMEIADLLRLQDVSAPAISPDGREVVYTVSSVDTDKDEAVSHVWLANWDGTVSRQLTFRADESESRAKFSPDGQWIAFVSSRLTGGEDEDAQDVPDRLWLLPRAGGEARPLAGIEGSVVDYAFAPDGRTIALVLQDPKPKPVDKDGKPSEDDRPQPVVIDRYRFKQDGVGLLDNRRERIWLYDMGTGKARRLSDGDFDETLPAWSPSGDRIAFVSRRTTDFERSADFNIFVARPDKAGAAPRQLTRYAGADAQPDGHSYPAWSPDGKTIAYVRAGDPKLIWYSTQRLATVPSEGGTETELTTTLDRNIYDPVWTPDGRSIRFVVEDDRRQYLASIPAQGGTVTPLLREDRVVLEPAQALDGRIAVLATDLAHPPEVHVLDGGKLRAVSHHNDKLLGEVDLGTTRPQDVAGESGVHGFVTTPPGYKPGKRLPTFLFLHGGPVAQYDYSFDPMAQIMAAKGYAVIQPNPRGSSGRGEGWSSAINAAWGGVDVQDVLAATDDLVARGIADPKQLFVGGWSYGGMLTNYVIASDTRFRAAMAGASIANVYAGYGVDHYVYEYDVELGTPWANREAWDRVSYPFLQNQRIVTPTLFMVGSEDVNVPTIASEQMYQALRNRGIEARLVIYPGEAHGFTRPSFLTDRMTRWLDWYEKHKP